MQNVLCAIECKDWILLIMGFLGTYIWLIIIYQIKPSLTIENVDFSKKLSIEVVNTGYFNANNIKIEVCAVQSDFTFHFKLDLEEFITIPRKKKDHYSKSPHIRVFKSNDLAISAIEYTSFENVRSSLLAGNCALRVRIHASHEFTGFGRLKEFHFKYDTNKRLFINE